MYESGIAEIDILGMAVEEVAAAAEGQDSEELQEAVLMLQEFLAESSLVSAVPDEVDEFVNLFVDELEALDTDGLLAASMEGAGNVVLGMPFFPGAVLGNPDSELPEYISVNSISEDNVNDRIGAEIDGLYPWPANQLIPPIERLGTLSSGIGHVTQIPDVDGGIRYEPLIMSYYDQYYPSIALVLAAKTLNLGIEDIKIYLGEGVQLGRLNISTDEYLRMNTFFYTSEDDRPPFSIDSFFDVYEGKIPADKYSGKLVLIGTTAIGIGVLQKTPVAGKMESLLTLAHTVSSILEEDFFVSPPWAQWAQLGAFLVIAIYLMILLPRMRAGIAFIFSAVLLLALIGTHVTLMSTQRTWLHLMMPAVLLFFGHLLITTKRFLVTERGKLESELAAADVNRMLGLSQQGKGELDQAFASFRKVPMDEAVMDLLYNLALDFERKRQHNKAGSVYLHMSEFDPNFRDLAQRLDRSRKLEETVMLGGAGASTAGGTLMLDGDNIQKPMLGRYQVEKELGKGAMGIVYLGKDPKINRVVAIKTMALAQEFEEDELDEVKERFFREAETAGRLNHSNIVTIFDAGEEHDLAYIAMEFIKGGDLADHAKPDQLLPLKTVLEITALSADALSYAHTLNVVHRDIKPANIMYEAESNMVKLTDFGIARITDSSKTKTGMVLGTPSYMSPEQLSGKKVDGRSDLFSLGVMLFQMTSGSLPFKGDSMATLMFKIANEEHPDVLEIKADLPPSVKQVIDKALKKDAEVRYQDGKEMATDLRACIEELGG